MLLEFGMLDRAILTVPACIRFPDPPSHTAPSRTPRMSASAHPGTTPAHPGTQGATRSRECFPEEVHAHLVLAPRLLDVCLSVLRIGLDPLGGALCGLRQVV